MARRSDEERERLARWLARNVPRLQQAKPGALQEWARYRHLLWTAAAKLMQIEEGTVCDAKD